jgi:hypothetical protein
MSAILTGSLWTATEEARASYSGSLLTITGTDFNLRTVTIGSSNVVGEGVYPLGPLNGNGASANVVLGQLIWNSALSGGRGSLIITTLSDSRVVGNFNFTAVSGAPGTPGEVTAARGVFDLPL